MYLLTACNIFFIILLNLKNQNLFTKINCINNIRMKPGIYYVYTRLNFEQKNYRKINLSIQMFNKNNNWKKYIYILITNIYNI